LDELGFSKRKIVVAIKQVPERDAQVLINPTGKWVEEAGLH
jgi:hypothetical protein